MKNPKFHILIIFLVVTACSPKTTQRTASVPYEEDLSPYRPVEEDLQQTAAVKSSSENVTPYVEPTHHINAELDSVLSIMTIKNLEVGYLPGFSIQVYSGRSREEATKAEKSVYDLFEGEQKAEIYYDQPVFRVKVGQYLSRLEAEKSFRLLKDKFPQALVLPENIPIK